MKKNDVHVVQFNILGYPVKGMNGSGRYVIEISSGLTLKEQTVLSSLFSWTICYKLKSCWKTGYILSQQ